MENKKTILELTNDQARNFFLQASRYCTIDLPIYFDFQMLLSKLEHQIGNKKLFDVQEKLPNDCENVNYKFLTNKDGNFAWRPLQIINPVIYICLVNRITEKGNWELIKNRFKLFQADNNRIMCYSLPLIAKETDEQRKTDVSTNISNWWEEIEQRSIELALRYQCVLVTDITDCYGSIYTHSIGWALHGKKEARDHRNVKPPTLIGCVIDDIIQAMSFRQTNGIPQGSVLMDFIAEMVLGYADMKLSEKIKEFEQKIQRTIEYNILRYRDDYRIFANTQEDAVIIAKILSEVLADLNMKLNTQKTFVSDNIIRDIIKSDKWYWNGAKHGAETLQKHLMLIHSLAMKYPNSGSISTAMSEFIDRLYSSKTLKCESAKVLISILVDIAYNNPRVNSSVIVCIGKILSIESDNARTEEILQLIEKKFENKANVAHWKVWLQRLTIKSNREKEVNSQELLCRIAAKNYDIHLWNVEWLKPQFKQILDDCHIINEDTLNNMSDVPEKKEGQVFIINSL